MWHPEIHLQIDIVKKRRSLFVFHVELALLFVTMLRGGLERSVFG